MIATRDYTLEDEHDFLALYRACLTHYRIAPATEEQEARVIALLSNERHMSCLLAFEGATLLGFATWSLTLPAGAGVALYMKELYVDQTARGKGVGRALLAGLLARAEAENCTRLDWQTDGDNPMSQAFYSRIEAPKFDKLNYRISASDFVSFRKRLTTL